MIEILISIGVLLVLGVAAFGWGADSRNSWRSSGNGNQATLLNGNGGKP
ncbi:MAG TPA: hypothetical protein VH987_09195 [Candidatus Limnocylindria bacterium]|jgi:hypothetical protein